MTLLQSIGRWLAGTLAGGSLFLSATAQPGYAVEASMSAMSRFAWVWTCARAIADDAGTLPLVAVRRAPGGSRRLKRELVDDPILGILERPSSGWTGTQLRRQLWLDYTLTGNWYLWRASPSELIRLHPGDVRPIAVPAGLSYLVVGYEVVVDSGERVEVGRDEILHGRDLSWLTGRAALLGESVIRCLHDDLTMELGAKKLAATQAQKGRPDVIMSTEHAVGPELLRELTEQWERSSTAGKSAFAVGRGVTVATPSWSPREFEFAARSEIVRDVILAAFGVPPARAGLASANYGTQKQQMRTYWESIRAKARIFDDVFSALAAPGVRLETDFSEVESLQVSYTERQQRVVTWTSLGATAAAAAQYEGFDDAPVPDERVTMTPSSGSGTSSRVDEPQGDKSLSAGLAGYLVESAPRYAALAGSEASGASGDLLRTWEVERLFAVLDGHVGAEHARVWADRVVADTASAAALGLQAGSDLALLRAFGGERAQRLAQQIAGAARTEAA